MVGGAARSADVVEARRLLPGCLLPRGDLARALARAAAPGAADEVRRVMIETTGLADPGPILATLMGDAVPRATGWTGSSPWWMR